MLYLASIEQRDLPLDWYAPKGVPWNLVELVARGWLPRDQEARDQLWDDEPYLPSSRADSKKRKADGRAAGTYLSCVHQIWY